MEAEIAIYVCEHVFTKERPILYLCKEDEEWQFLCGGLHREGEVPRVVGLNHILEDEPTIRALMNLPNNWEAERIDVESKWITSPIL